MVIGQKQIVSLCGPDLEVFIKPVETHIILSNFDLSRGKFLLSFPAKLQLATLRNWTRITRQKKIRTTVCTKSCTDTHLPHSDWHNNITAGGLHCTLNCTFPRNRRTSGCSERMKWTRWRGNATPGRRMGVFRNGIMEDKGTNWKNGIRKGYIG